MNCSEFLSRFSEFLDAPAEGTFPREAEAHLEECEKCTRYQAVVDRGVRMLQSMPRAEVPENFRPRLQHRLYHLDDVWVGSGASGSAVSIATALGMAILLTVIAWAPRALKRTPEVELPAIVVSGPPQIDGLFPTDPRGLQLPVSALNLMGGLWSDPNSLLYEYSPMRERYRLNRVVRRTGLD
ncbi:MAG: hypothetical protein VYD78_00905 [Gemmatimonadota bacterium]|nr:hypothetical protein [Gemmatimonadota bacterium]